MALHVLVAYATKKGSTREVAEEIALSLSRQGIETSVRPAAEVRDLDSADGVVLGGSLYMGRWHSDARRFLKRHRDTLTERPLAVFALGPLTMKEHDVAGSRKQLDRALAATPELEPVSVAIFGGVVDPAKLRFPFNHMSASDVRDWPAIHGWAEDFARTLDARLLVGV